MNNVTGAVTSYLFSAGQPIDRVAQVGRMLDEVGVGARPASVTESIEDIAGVMTAQLVPVDVQINVLRVALGVSIGRGGGGLGTAQDRCGYCGAYGGGGHGGFCPGPYVRTLPYATVVNETSGECSDDSQS